jgi:hypothetical protein
MKPRAVLIILLVVIGLPLRVRAARAASELQLPQKRQVTVTTAERIAQRSPAAPLPTELVSPFNPPDFDKPDVPEAAANPGAARPAPGGNSQAAPVQPSVPMGDRETLQALAAQLTPTGTIQIGDSPRLVMGSKRFEVGTRFTVTYNGQDYELELVAIDRTTFTLRYRGEEITRPIKTVR